LKVKGKVGNWDGVDTIEYKKLTGAEKRKLQTVVAFLDNPFMNCRAILSLAY
jgi:hypothetical protein